jgi:hypothetical protein
MAPPKWELAVLEKTTFNVERMKQESRSLFQMEVAICLAILAICCSH